MPIEPRRHAGRSDDGSGGLGAGRFPLDVFAYHAVIREPLPFNDWCFLDETLFRADVGWLKAHYDVIPLVEGARRLQAGFSRPTAAITFDDGFQNVCDVAVPILRDAGLPGTIFLCTDFVDTAQTLWFCRLHDALTRAAVPSFNWGGRKFDLADASSRAQASAELQWQLKQHAHSDLLVELSALVAALSTGPEPPIGPESPYRILRRTAIDEMGASGLIDFGAHTCRHAILSTLSQREKRDEIIKSVADVATLTGRPCRLFAYPNGRREDYDLECVDLLAEQQVECAVTAISGRNVSSTPVLELKRWSIGAESRVADLLAGLDSPHRRTG